MNQIKFYKIWEQPSTNKLIKEKTICKRKDCKKYKLGDVSKSAKRIDLTPRVLNLQTDKRLNKDHLWSNFTEFEVKI